MTTQHNLKESFDLNTDPEKKFNPHYDFENKRNQAEISKMGLYDWAFNAMHDHDSEDQEEAANVLAKMEKDALGGLDGYAIGVRVDSEWGINTVVDFRKENNEDVCIKDITVFPNNMLSLQNHRGRTEVWEVQEGTLSLIMNADVYEVSDAGVFKVTNGQREQITDPAVATQNNGHWAITLPKGAIHCMINRSDDPVRVIETQRGITREADNNRYADQQRGKEAPRATIPLKDENQYKSALLYWQIEREIAMKPGLNWKVSYTPDSAVA